LGDAQVEQNCPEYPFWQFEQNATPVPYEQVPLFLQGLGLQGLAIQFPKTATFGDGQDPQVVPEKPFRQPLQDATPLVDEQVPPFWQKEGVHGLGVPVHFPPLSTLGDAQVEQNCPEYPFLQLEQNATPVPYEQVPLFLQGLGMQGLTIQFPKASTFGDWHLLVSETILNLLMKAELT